jgi:uncharacterized protein with HEPN domain
MELEVSKLLYDMEQAVTPIQEFTQGKQFTDYQQDALLRSGVERQFEIIGEAMNRLKRVDATVLDKISYQQRIIGFRNILAHGYDSVSNEMVWDIVQNYLGILTQELNALKE